MTTTALLAIGIGFGVFVVTPVVAAAVAVKRYIRRDEEEEILDTMEYEKKAEMTD